LITRDKKGAFNFTDILTLSNAENKKQTSSDNFPVDILKTAIIDGKLSWQDDFYSHPQKEDIYPINLNIDDFITTPQQQSQLNISLASPSGGQLKWQGDIKLFPFSSSGSIKLDKLGFHRIWQLFLQDNVNFKLPKGTETFKTQYQLSENNKGMQLLLNNAYLAITDFQLTEKGTTAVLISIPNFRVSGASLDLQKKKIIISTISAKNAHFKA
jgi:hypothetical protein